MKLETIWDFVEAYYPNYSSCNEIATNEDLTKIIDGQLNGNAEEMYNKEFEEHKRLHGGMLDDSQIEEEVLKHFDIRLGYSNAYIYERAIDNYIALKAKKKAKKNKKFMNSIKGSKSSIEESFEKLFHIETKPDEIIKTEEKIKTKEFVNGFTSWQETHFEVIDFITTERQKEPMQGEVFEIHKNYGTGGLYELAEKWTNEFELKYKDIIWGEDLEFFDTIEEFLISKNQEN